MKGVMDKIFALFGERQKLVYDKHRGMKHDTWLDANQWPKHELLASLKKAQAEIESLFEISECDELDDFSRRCIEEQIARQCVDVANWSMFLWHHMAGEEDGY